MIPVLLITWNRLAYTKKALESLLRSDCGTIHIYDNCSEDGTQDYLKMFTGSDRVRVVLNKKNTGIAGAWNYFLWVTNHAEFVVKCDNDTLLPPDFCARMIPHMEYVDLCQAKHPLIKASGVGTFDEWTSNMPKVGELRLNSFIGGSGIMCRRSVLGELEHTKNKLMSWRLWQAQHSKVIKGFATDVEIELLDTTEAGADYSAYPEYYKETGRT